MNCADCGVLITDDNKFLDTERCLECTLKYRYCNTCGEFMLMVAMRSEQCPPCFREHPTLADCHCRIKAEPLGVGTRFFGVELETEVSGSGKIAIEAQIKKIDKLVGEHVLMKHDGSLDHGIEIVTRPATREKQYWIWNKFCAVPHPKLKSFDTKSCGLHVHVNRKSVNEPTTAKVVCFVNADVNKRFMFVIAGRTSSDYTKFKNKTLADACKYSGDRYEAVNLSNEETVEFRMFKGTLKKESIFKAIEFCDAICDYCSQEPTVRQSISRTGFIRFVRQQNKWPHLLAFIQAKWYGVATELSEQVKWSIAKNCSISTEYNLTLTD